MNSPNYKKAWAGALSEIREAHPTEWRLLYILFRFKDPKYQGTNSLVKREMIKAYHDEFHGNLRIWRENYR